MADDARPAGPPPEQDDPAAQQGTQGGQQGPTDQQAGQGGQGAPAWQQDPNQGGPGAAPGAPPQAPPPRPLTPDEERTWGMLAHLSALIGLLSIPSLVGPLIVWLVQREKSAFVDDQGKEALNFHITVTIALVACFVIGFILLIVLVGIVFFILGFVIGVLALVFTIIGAIQANQGNAYRYPFNIRMIK